MPRDKGYIWMLAPDDWPGKRYIKNLYCYEHQYIYWKNTGILAKANELIHHKNEIKDDNRFENLELKTRGKHTSDHAKPPRYIKFKCTFCGNNFERRYKDVVTKMKNGQKDFYCNRTCMSKHFGRGRIKTGSNVIGNMLDS